MHGHLSSHEQTWKVIESARGSSECYACGLIGQALNNRFKKEREEMSIVIVGGHERMERQYTELCKKHGCKSKVFCKYQTGMESRIGNPDLLIVFTHTVSHKAMKCAMSCVPKTTDVVRCHNSSQAALSEILCSYVQ